MNKKMIIRICIIMWFCLVGLALSPFIIGITALNPKILGIPVSLWGGIAISMGIFFITIVVAVVSNDTQEEKQ